MLAGGGVVKAGGQWPRPAVSGRESTVAYREPLLTRVITLKPATGAGFKDDADFYRGPIAAAGRRPSTTDYGFGASGSSLLALRWRAHSSMLSRMYSPKSSMSRADFSQ